jgi:hypothetical protein
MSRHLVLRHSWDAVRELLLRKIAHQVSGLTPPRWLERRTSHGSIPAPREGFPLTSWRDRR